MGVGMSRSLPAQSRSPAFFPPPPPRSTTTTFFPPPPPPPPTTTTTMTISANRVIAFHSSAKWRAYMESSKSSNKLIVVDFTATWCGPCKMMEPILNELASKFAEVDFVKIDVDELMEVSTQYGVQVLPTILLMKKGQMVDKVVGVNKEDLRKKIELHSLNPNYTLNNGYYQYN